MPESFVNKYVIQIKSGHPGNTEYEIISTPNGFIELIRSIKSKIERIDRLSTDDPQYKVSPTLLWSDSATLSPGKASRIYLSFRVDENLETYHRSPTIIKRLISAAGYVLVVTILLLAIVGGVAIVRGIF